MAVGVLSLAAPAGADETVLRRNYLGGLIGGSAALQFVYQHRVADPLLLEAGGALLGPIGNFSASAVLEPLPRSPVIPYLAPGAGAMYGCGAGDTEEDPETGEVQGEGGGCDGAYFLVARAGIAVPLGSGKVKLSLDGGFWYGRYPWSEKRIQPMAGFGFYIPL